MLHIVNTYTLYVITMFIHALSIATYGTIKGNDLFTQYSFCHEMFTVVDSVNALVSIVLIIRLLINIEYNSNVCWIVVLLWSNF